MVLKNNLKILYYIACTIFIFGLIFVISVNVIAAYNYKKEKVPFVFGVVSSKVSSGSMEPYIMTGDYIVLRKIDNDDILIINNVYSYKYEDRFVLHRFLGYDKNGDLIFRGDANNGNDYPVKRDQVIAEYQYTVDNYMLMPFQFITMCVLVIELLSFATICYINSKIKE